MKISPHYTDTDWVAAFSDTPNWNQAIKIVEDRIKGRWLSWADKIAEEQFSGFAVLALDCIVLESLWGFIHGTEVPKRREPEVYREMLTGSLFGLTNEQSDSFRKFVRNGLMHDAETRSRWLIEQTMPRDAIIARNDSGDHILNRTKFHQMLKAALEDWLVKLRDGDQMLLENMSKRMNEVIRKHYAR
jgi:hypothetical protein